MPVIGTSDITRVSDLVITEDTQARRSRDDVTAIASANVLVGHLLKPSADEAGKVEIVATAEDLEAAQFVAIYNTADILGNRMAVLARACQVRAGKLRLPKDTTAAQLTALKSRLGGLGIILRD